MHTPTSLPRQLLVLLLALATAVVAIPAPAHAAVALIAAKGGSALSADDAADADGRFTALTNPSVLEDLPGDITTGTLVIAAPEGFEFRRQRITAFATPGGSAPTSLTVAAEDCAAAGRTAYLSAAADEIRLEICSTSEDSGKRTRLTLSGLAVRPVAATPLTRGAIHVDAASTATIDGVTPGPTGTSLGDLASVVGELASIAADPSAISTTPTATTAITAVATDAHGNRRTEGVTLSADPAVGTVQDGVFTAGTTATSAPAGITARAGDLTVDVPVEVLPGPLARIAVAPQDATTAAGDPIGYTTTGFDAWDNSRGVQPEAVLTATADDAASDPSAAPGTCGDGACTATRAGGYAVTSTVEGLTTTTTLTVVPAELARVTLTPDPVQIKAGEDRALEAIAEDAHGNRRADAITFSADPAAGTVDARGVLTAATRVADVPAGVTAAVGDIGDSAEVRISAGPVEVVTLTLDAAEAAAGTTVGASTTTTDEFGNPVEAEVLLTIAPVAGGTTEGASCTALGCTAERAGLYEITATADGRSDTAQVEVVAGPAHRVELSPATTVVRVEESAPVEAVVVDRFGNLRADLVEFAVTDGGTFSAGRVIAGTLAGRFAEAITATSGDLTATADLQVLAGDAAELRLSPATTTTAAGEPVALTVEAADRHGNAVDVADITFGIAPDGEGASDGATCDETGVCAAERAGTYRVTAVSGEAGGTARIDVTPAAAAALRLDPATVTATAGATVEVTGIVTDRFGNRRADAVALTADPAAGTFGEGRDRGVLTAARTAGTVVDGITATSGGLETTADVVISAGDVARLAIDPAAATALAGDLTTFATTAFDRFDNVVDGVVPALSITAADGETSVEGATCDADACRAERVGDYQVVAGHEAVVAIAALTVTPAALDAIAVDVAPRTVAGEPAAVSTTGTDAFGNAVATTPTLSIAPVVDGATAGATCDDASCTATRTGGYAITATDGDVTGTAPLTIDPAALHQVEVDPIIGQAAVETTTTFTGLPIDRFGNATTDPVTFTTADERAGTIDADGVLTAGRLADFFPGAVLARAGDFAVYADVEVMPGAVSRVTLIPGETTLPAGGVEVFAVEGTDRFGNSRGAVDATFAITPIRGGAADGAVCTDGGECTAERAGTYEVRATHADGATTTATLTIEAGELAAIVLDPETATVEAGGSQTYTATGTDADGNELGEVEVDLAIEDGTCADGACTATTAGDHVVTATHASGATAEAVLTVVPADAATVELTPTAVEVVAGEQQQMTASVRDAFGNARADEVAFTADPAAGTIDAEGLFTAGDRVGTVEEAIRATAGDVFATADVTVTAAPTTTVVVTPAEATTQAGTTQVFTAEGRDAFGNPTGPAEIAIEAPATCVDGACTAEQAGTYVVTATHASGVVETAVLTVEPAAAATLELQPAAVEVVAGGTAVLEGVVRDAFGNRRADVVTYAADPAVGTIAADGTLTAAERAGSTPAAVTATSGELTDTADVTITAAPTDSVVLTPAEAEVEAGATQVFTAEGRDAFGNPTGPAEITIEAPATCVDGACTAEQAGTYAATATHPTGRTAQAVLTVVPAAPAALELTPAAVEVVAGGTQQMTAVVTDAYGNPRADVVDLAVAPAAGTIDEQGLLTAAEVEGSHPAAVTATSGELTDTADVTITAAPTDSVVLTPAEAEVEAGVTQVFTAEGRDVYGNPTGPAEITIGAPATCVDGACTAEQAGTYAVTATHPSGVVATGTLTVTPAAVDAVEITPAVVEAQPEDVVQLAASAVDRFGNATGAAITWTADPAAGTITPEGAFTAGTTAATYPAGITATADGVTGAADVTVVPGPAERLAISPTAAEVVAGDDGQVFTASAVDAYGNETGDVAVTLTATPDDEGRETDVSCQADTCGGTTAGRHTVVATDSAGATATAALTVTPAPATGVGATATPDRVNASPVPGNQSTIRVTLVDPFGNPIDGAVTLRFSKKGSSGTVQPQLSTTSTTTGADGVAEVGYTAGSQAGQDLIQVSAGKFARNVIITVQGNQMARPATAGGGLEAIDDALGGAALPGLGLTGTDR